MYAGMENKYPFIGVTPVKHVHNENCIHSKEYHLILIQKRLLLKDSPLRAVTQFLKGT